MGCKHTGAIMTMTYPLRQLSNRALPMSKTEKKFGTSHLVVTGGKNSSKVLMKSFSSTLCNPASSYC